MRSRQGWTSKHFTRSTLPQRNRCGRTSRACPDAPTWRQETYCRFLTSKLGNVEPAQAKPYLFRIATNLLHDRWRKGEDTPWSEPREIGFERDLDTQIDVRDLMQQLKPRERQLLWLAYVEGMTHSEIARATGLRSMSIRILLFRARQRAAELLGRKERAVHEV